MQVGDLIVWSWNLAVTWDDMDPITEFTGIVVNSRIVKTDYEKFRILAVLANDGTVLDVRDDEATLRVISENR
jgi:hypothetical protein